MTNHGAGFTAFRVVVAVCLAAGLAVVVAAECKVGRVELPDPTTLKLPDGDHVIGSADTERGRFEARVTVRGKVMSDPRYFIGGRPLQLTPESQAPKDIMQCIQESRQAAALSGSWLSRIASSTRDWLEAPVYAWRGKCTVLPSCSQTTCCALVKCADARAVWCEAIKR